jgi:hypothetical protein
MLPLVTNLQIVSALKTLINGQYVSCSKVEIMTEFPSDMTKARSGIYISDVAVVDRSPYQLAVNYGGNIYIISESFTITYTSFQGDALKDQVSGAIQDLVYDNVLFDGYHERDYTVSDSFENRAEYKTFEFLIKRIDFQ